MSDTDGQWRALPEGSGEHDPEEETEKALRAAAAYVAAALAKVEDRHGRAVAQGVLLALSAGHAPPPGHEEEDTKRVCAIICVVMGWTNPYPEVVPPVVVGPPADA